MEFRLDCWFYYMQWLLGRSLKMWISLFQSHCVWLKESRKQVVWNCSVLSLWNMCFTKAYIQTRNNYLSQFFFLMSQLLLVLLCISLLTAQRPSLSLFLGVPCELSQPPEPASMRFTMRALRRIWVNSSQSCVEFVIFKDSVVYEVANS